MKKLLICASLLALFETNGKAVTLINDTEMVDGPYNGWSAGITFKLPDVEKTGTGMPKNTTRVVDISHYLKKAKSPEDSLSITVNILPNPDYPSQTSVPCLPAQSLSQGIKINNKTIKLTTISSKIPYKFKCTIH